MSSYLDQILGIYAPDVPGVREALTAIVEREIAERIDGVKDGRFLVVNTYAGLTRRAERAEADAATLRAFVQAMADEKTCEDDRGECYQDSGPYCGSHGLEQYRITDARKVLAALTSRGQG